MRRLIRICVVAAPVIAVAGCGTQTFHAKTILHSDGSIERAIYQPRSETPLAAQTNATWDAVRPVAADQDVTDWDGGIGALRTEDDEEDNKYLAARGRFESAASIPEYYRKELPDSSAASRFVRGYQRRDFVFAVEHAWHEALTDVVTLTDLRKARRELAALAIRLFQISLERGLGDDYDVAPLIAWLKGEGTELFFELTDEFYESSVLKRSDEEARQRFEEVAARYGIASLDKEAIAAFCRHKLHELVRRRDGEPVGEEAVEGILDWLNLGSEDEENPIAVRLRAEAEATIAAEYGDKEAFEMHWQSLAGRIFGVYWPFGAVKKFHFTLQVPGLIVETNGTLRSENRVAWSFSAPDAYPHGYVMSCRSLEPVASEQERLLGSTPLTDRAALLEFVDLVGGDEELQDALQASAEQDSFGPLQDLADQVDAGDKERRRTLARLWALLGRAE